MQLTPSDLRSETWKHVREGISARIAELREKNDSLGDDQITTSATRGRIAELKRMLSLAEEASGNSSALPGFDPASDMAVFSRD